MSKIIFTKKELGEAKASAEELYKNIGEVHCTYLKRTVIFNAKGLDHIKLKRWNHARSEQDQFVRLRLLHLVPEVLKQSHTLQGIDEGNRFERVKVNSRWETTLVHICYYEFIMIISGCRLRIVIKKIDDGQPFFWSIIPYWKQGDRRKRMFEGNPEED